jgi:hypothetical protein
MLSSFAPRMHVKNVMGHMAQLRKLMGVSDDMHKVRAAVPLAQHSAHVQQQRQHRLLAEALQDCTRCAAAASIAPAPRSIKLRKAAGATAKQRHQAVLAAQLLRVYQYVAENAQQHIWEPRSTGFCCRVSCASQTAACSANRQCRQHPSRPLPLSVAPPSQACVLLLHDHDYALPIHSPTTSEYQVSAALTYVPLFSLTPVLLHSNTLSRSKQTQTCVPSAACPLQPKSSGLHPQQQQTKPSQQQGPTGLDHQVAESATAATQHQQHPRHHPSPHTAYHTARHPMKVRHLQPYQFQQGHIHWGSTCGSFVAGAAASRTHCPSIRLPIMFSGTACPMDCSYLPACGLLCA